MCGLNDRRHGAPRPACGAALETEPGGRPTEEIETGSPLQVPFGGAVGRRYAIDEHAFNPLRARVKVGTQVMFVDNGRITHTVGAQDWGWSSPSLDPARTFHVTCDEPGTLVSRCTEHGGPLGHRRGDR